MQRIDNWDSIEAYTGEFPTLPAGAYICRVLSAKEDKFKSGAKCIALLLDIEEGEYKGFFKKRYESDTRTDKKYPCVYRQGIEGKSVPFFKGLITSIEKSNYGYVWDWNEKTLKGKLIGGIFGREEYEPNKWTTKCVNVRSTESVYDGTAEVPKDKPFKAGNSVVIGGENVGFEEIGNDEELPF